jgi:drug/metabolite transporter (DMT)-like permease
MITSSDRPVLGIGFVVAGYMFLSIMDGVVKWLVNGDVSSVQIVAYRGWMVLIVLLLAIPFNGGMSSIKTGHLGAHTLRALIGCLAPVLFFEGLRYLSMADSTTLFFGSAFMMTAISAIFLGEKVGIHRWSAIVIGFVGVVIVTRPGDAFQLAALFPIGASISYAIFAVMGRWLGKNDSTFTLVFYYNAGLTLVMTAALPFFWQPIASDIISGIGVIAALSLLGHLAVHRAFRLAPISVLAPYEYTALVWAIIIDYYYFETVPTMVTLIGAAIIVSCGLYIVYRETRLNKEPLIIENT